MSDTTKRTYGPDDLTPATLQNLERQLTASLYAVWLAQGKNKRIVNERQKVEKRGSRLVEVNK